MATKEPNTVSRERMRREADIRGPSIQARLRLESEEVEKSTLIREWQDKTVEQPPVGSGGVISRLFNSCVSLLRSILKCSKGKDGLHGDYMQLQESLMALILWGEDHHLSTETLDTHLHDSEDLRGLVCSLILSLADLLVNGLLQHIVTSPAERHATIFKYDMLSVMHEARKEFSIVETPVDYTRDNVPNMAATLGTLVDCLICLNQQSAKDDSNDQYGYLTVIEDRPPYHYHVELVASKFPNAPQPLLERLGKCNWERYLRLQERRETVKDEEESVQVGNIESKSRFDDSALGTSVPAQSEFGGSVSTYAETVVSSRAASCHQKLPKLPKDGRNGKRFICQVCNRVVAIRYSRDWKKHVFQDLLAYTCIYDGCSVDARISLWEDRLAMTNHLAAEHGLGPEWKSHPCPLCRLHTGEGKEVISLHISRHMEEIALNALPSGYESDSESETNSAVTDSPSMSGQDYGSRSIIGIPISVESENHSLSHDNSSEYFTPTPGDPSPPSISTTTHLSGAPLPDNQHDSTFRVARAAKNVSPEPNTFGDKAHEYLDRKTNVLAKPVFQDSSNNTYMHQVKTSQAPTRYDPKGYGYPLLNSADQNPPCNTLYVGNLPIDTSEDELKAVFSIQRGYKRLCFRTKATGSMCFVEFEDISFATRALNELYGYPLHNSVKGGIRLSFSKNPLGVRNGQTDSKNIGLTPETPQNTGIERGLAPWSPVAEKGFREPGPPDQGPDISTNPLLKDAPNDTYRHRIQERQKPDIQDQQQRVSPTLTEEGSPTALSNTLGKQYNPNPALSPGKPGPLRVSPAPVFQQTPSGNPPSPHSEEWMAIAAQEMESHPINERMRPNTPPAPSYSPLPRRNGLPKKTVRFEIPPERSLLNIDQLIAQSTNEEEIKELKQQKRLLLNKQAALEARNRKESQDHQNDELTKEQTSRMSDADSMRIKNQFRKLAKEIEEEEFKT